MTATLHLPEPRTTAATRADILVPLDGSAFAEQALSVAEALAFATGSALQLLRVNEPLLPGGLPAARFWRDEVFRIREEYLLEMAAESRAHGVRTSTTLRDGAAIPAIRSEVEGSGASLVVMATHGRTGVQRAWLGSVADGVARHSNTPILLHRPASGLTYAPFTGFRRLLVPLDGSRSAEGAIAPAVFVANAFDATIVLLRVVPPVQLPVLPVPMAPPVSAPDRVLTELQANEAALYLEDVALRLHAQGVSDVVQRVIVSPAIADAVVTAAAEAQADLVVVTSRRQGPARLAFGSLPDRVLRKLELSMLLAPEAA